ncbi:hypothetical protein GBAR_LOCUS13650 [Geodia barretti]|uniref:Uncharacterized protein n=1 Tax=Geodia barretti TaxID=519541 RepID=A0AA35S7J1_GEOBA|nr:hypothetical protein GBAR_LOCUS13650 [Geodia barretti]
MILPSSCRSIHRSRTVAASPTSTSTSIPRFSRHMSAINCACSGRNGTSPAFQV